MSEAFLLVDFENVRELDLAALPEGWRVKIFLGRLQKSIPTELTTAAQPLGERLEWIRMEGDGHNNLDFHLAFYLGQLSQEHPTATFVILTKDKGFDPLLKHLAQSRSIQCRRISTFEEVVPPPMPDDDSQLGLVCKTLLKMKKSRPRRRKSLVQHVASLRKDLSEAEVEKIVKQLMSKRLVSETNNALTYHF